MFGGLIDDAPLREYGGRTFNYDPKGAYENPPRTHARSLTNAAAVPIITRDKDGKLSQRAPVATAASSSVRAAPLSPKKVSPQTDDSPLFGRRRRLSADNLVSMATSSPQSGPSSPTSTLTRVNARQRTRRNSDDGSAIAQQSDSPRVRFTESTIKREREKEQRPAEPNRSDAQQAGKVRDTMLRSVDEGFASNAKKKYSCDLIITGIALIILSLSIYGRTQKGLQTIFFGSRPFAITALVLSSFATCFMGCRTYNSRSNALALKRN